MPARLAAAVLLGLLGSCSGCVRLHVQQTGGGAAGPTVQASAGTPTPAAALDAGPPDAAALAARVAALVTEYRAALDAACDTAQLPADHCDQQRRQLAAVAAAGPAPEPDAAHSLLDVADTTPDPPIRHRLVALAAQLLASLVRRR